MYIPRFYILDYLNSISTDFNLSKCKIICVQHVVASTISLFQSLFEKGLLAENLSIIGKCYSTRPEALKHLVDKNVDVSKESLYFNPYNSFDEEFKRMIISFFKEKIDSLEGQEFEKLIVLDDGGELLLFINDIINKKPFWIDKVVGIEQTTAGYDKLKTANLLFPIVNVARSGVKLFHESPFIASVAVERLICHLNKLNLHPQNALVVGNGAVGSHICCELKEVFDVAVHDLDLTKSSFQEGFSPDMLRDFDMIVGCTGKTVIFPSDFKFLKKDACLVSVSSSDREFSGVHLRKNVKDIFSCHQDVYSNGVYLLNCGFPINFDDAYGEIDIPEFQLTRAILLAGIYQAITLNHSKGLIDLDQNIQNTIIELYKNNFYSQPFREKIFS